MPLDEEERAEMMKDQINALLLQRGEATNQTRGVTKSTCSMISKAWHTPTQKENRCRTPFWFGPSSSPFANHTDHNLLPPPAHVRAQQQSDPVNKQPPFPSSNSPALLFCSVVLCHDNLSPLV